MGAVSVFAAIAASTVKIPSEKNLMGHLFWLRDLIDRKVLSHLQWADTRDMSSDGHTKGSIDREMLLEGNDGCLYVPTRHQDLTSTIETPRSLEEGRVLAR